MGCCCSTKKDPEIFVPRSQRWCTDLLFLIAFIVCWGLGIALAVVTINKDPSLIDDILYPRDSYGNNCGKPGTATENLPKVFYPQLDTDIRNQIDVFTSYRYWDFKPTRLCASSCPSGFSVSNPIAYGGPTYPCGYDDTELSSGQNVSTEFGSGETCATGSVPTYYYIYVTQDVVSRCFPFDDSRVTGDRLLCAQPSCTSPGLNASLNGNVQCTSVADADATNVWAMCTAGTPDSVCTAQRSACELVLVEASSVRYHPESETDESSKYTTELANFFAMVIGGVNGLVRSEALIAQGLCGILLPVLLGFVWAIFLWLFAGILIYTLITLLIVVCLIGVFFFMYKAGWFGQHITLTNIYNSTLTQTAAENEQTWYGVLAIILLVLTLIIIIFFFLSRKAIKRLIAIVEECTKVFKAMSAIVLWPILLQLPLELGVFFYGAFISYYIAVVWTESGSMLTFILLHLLLIFWTVNLIKATVWSSMAAAVGVWYTTINAPGSSAHGFAGCGTGCSELWDSTFLILAKHMGSMAFGSLILGICQLLRLVLATIDYYTQDLQDKNLFLKIAMKCSQCVMYCLQKTIEFISYFGYIFVATRGENFCKACVSTFGFVCKYMAQTAVNKTVQSLLRLLIGWSIPFTCSIVTFLILDSIKAYEDYNAMWPALIVFISSFIIADGICTVYDCCIDTIYLLSFEDMSRSGGPKYMSADLRAGFGFDNAENEVSSSATKYKSVAERRNGPAFSAGSTSV
ncbi:hypothetical protein AB1Y20_005572 [Prymnesium parvum]|uniref:Choline transporter-like protein n=1 Tax=Prymnesium parvum TaxID=97485 RepID=A0AB34J654_PRYPA